MGAEKLICFGRESFTLLESSSRSNLRDSNPVKIVIAAVHSSQLRIEVYQEWEPHFSCILTVMSIQREKFGNRFSDTGSSKLRGSQLRLSLIKSNLISEETREND